METKENPGNPEENMGCTEAAELTEETEEQYNAALSLTNEEAISRAYEEARLIAQLDKSHPYIRKSDGKRFTVEEFEAATKPGTKAKKDDFVLRPRSMAAITPAMLAHQSVWAIERCPNYWNRGKLVDAIAEKLFVRNDDPSIVIVEARYDDLTDSAKENYTRIQQVQYKDDKAKLNPVEWSSMKQRMSPAFRQARAAVILRSPDVVEWRGHWERQIEGGADVMVEVEALLPSHPSEDIDPDGSQIAEMAQGHHRDDVDEVPGE